MEENERNFDILVAEKNKQRNNRDIETSTKRTIFDIFLKYKKRSKEDQREYPNLSKTQHELINLAAECVRGFNSLKENLKDLKIGKEEDELREIEKTIKLAKHTFTRTYQSYKTQFKKSK